MDNLAAAEAGASIRPEKSSLRELKLGLYSPREVLLMQNTTLSHQNKTTIRQEYEDFMQKQPDNAKKILPAFERFLFDPGLNREARIKVEEYDRIVLTSEPNFSPSEKTASAIEFYNQPTMVDIAADAMIAGNSVAFINVDLKKLRNADLIGYAEHLLRRVSQLMLNQSKSESKDNFFLVPGRVGGDEFTSLVISHTRDDSFSKKVDAILAELNELYHNSGNAYFQNIEFKTDEQGTIHLSSQDVAEEPDFKLKETIIPNKEEIRQILLGFLQHGGMPEQEIVNKTEAFTAMDDSKYRLSRTEDINKMVQDTVATISKAKDFYKKHSEFAEEEKIFSDLVDHNFPHLAISLYFHHRNYLTDSIFVGEKNPILKFPDFTIHIKDKSGQLYYLYCPWTKIFNTKYGRSSTDNIIRQIKVKFDSLFAFDGTRARKGGDFAFFTETAIYVSANGDNVVYVELELPQSDNPFAELTGGLAQAKDLPKGKVLVPLILSHYDIKSSPDDSSEHLGSVIENIEHTSRHNFIQWLNKVFVGNHQVGENILEYYLSERGPERLFDLRYWLEKNVKEEHLSREFLDLLFNRIKLDPKGEKVVFNKL